MAGSGAYGRSRPFPVTLPRRSVDLVLTAHIRCGQAELGIMELDAFMTVAGPAITSAAAAYGGAVLTRAEEAAADATVGLGQRIINSVWRRRDMQQQAELEACLDDATRPGGEDAMGALRHQIRCALRSDPELLAELAALLPTGNPQGATRVEARGAGSVATGGSIYGSVSTNVTTTPASPTAAPAGAE